MKKLFTLLLTLLLVLSLGFACAEEEMLEEIVVPEGMILQEVLYDGSWIQFEDGFEVYLPIEWQEYPLTEEMNAQGIFYMAGTEDMSYSCAMGWQALEEACTIEELVADLLPVYPDAKIIDGTGVAMAYYEDAENNLMNYIALDGTEPGIYMFAFTPADDPVFNVLSAFIASTLRNY